MTGIGLNAVFVLCAKGFMCSNEGTISVDADLVKSVDGTSRSINRTKTLRLKSAFTHGEAANVGSEVVCLTRMITGNVFHYSGRLSFVAEDGTIGVTLTSASGTDKIDEIIKTIASM